MSRHSDGSRFGPYVIFLIDYPNIKSLKHRNTEKSKGSNTKRWERSYKGRGLGAENDNSVSSASHCRTVKIMSL